MRSLRLSLAIGLCFLPKLWDEFANGKMFRLRAKGRFFLENLRLLRVAVR
jgi:hypothetical protein